MQLRLSPRSMATLALAGLLSALLSILAELLIDWSFAPGMIFGLALAFCLHRLKWVKSVKELAGFVAICTAAYPAAFWIGLAYPSWFPLFRTVWNGFIPPTNAFFVAGLAGGAIVVIAFLLLLRIRDLRSAALISIVGSVISGLLGVAGWLWDGKMSTAIDHVLTVVHISTDSPRNYAELASIFITWQTGMALLLAVSFWLSQRSDHARTPLQDSPRRPLQIGYPT